VPGERCVVVEQCRVLVELDPDMVVASQRQDDRLTAAAVAGSSVAVHRRPVSVVHHHPGEHVAAVLTEHVRREQVGAVQLADEVRRVDVERVADVGEDDVEGDRSVLQHRAELLTPSDRERHSTARRPAARLALLSLQSGEPREAAVTLRSYVARRSGLTPAAVATSPPLVTWWSNGSRQTYSSCTSIDTTITRHFNVH